MELPEKCCAKCLWWSPNRRTDFKDGEPKLCWKLDVPSEDDFYCPHFVGAKDTVANVPNHTPNGIMIERNKPLPDVACEGLIVTFGTPTMRVSGKFVSEIDWLDYSLRSYFKWCSGFQGLTVAHPNHEASLFKSLADKYDIRLFGYDEVAGKGFVQHQAIMALADTFLPDATTHILHWDSDCVWKMPTTPMDYFYNDKPLYIYRTYESLIEKDPKDPRVKIIQDNYQWKTPGDAQLGFASDVFTMTRHPSIFPVDFYPKYRAQLELIHGKSIMQYFIEGKNSHPQDRLDFTTMGSFAWEKMRDRFHWFNCGDGSEYPIDRQTVFWSHGSVTPEIAQQLENLIAGKAICAPILLG